MVKIIDIMHDIFHWHAVNMSQSLMIWRVINNSTAAVGHD